MTIINVLIEEDLDEVFVFVGYLLYQIIILKNTLLRYPPPCLEMLGLSGFQNYCSKGVDFMYHSTTMSPEEVPEYDSVRQ